MSLSWYTLLRLNNKLLKQYNLGFITEKKKKQTGYKCEKDYGEEMIVLYFN